MAEQAKRFRALFQGLDSCRTARERRGYVRDEMVRQIESGDFSLTEWMNQRPAARQIVGDVIFGHGVSDGSDGHEALSHVTSYPVPREISDARVNIEACDGRTNIRYTDGSRPIEDIIVGSQGRFTIPQVEPNVIDLGTYKATVSLRTAWLILKSAGEWVVRGILPADRSWAWLYREVPASQAHAPTRRQREERAS